MKVADLLVPHDLSTLSDRTLTALADRGIVAQRVHVIHVLPRIDRTYTGVIWDREHDEPRRDEASRSLRERLHGPWTPASVHVVIGDPATRIVERAAEVGADLVALASHSRRGLERVLYGSVAEHVVRFAPCPVLVLPAVTIPEVRRAPAEVAWTDAEQDVDEPIDQLAVHICALVESRDGFLSALRIGLPQGQDRDLWEDRLVQRLAAAGIEFVDLAFTPISGPRPELLAARFEELPAER